VVIIQRVRVRWSAASRGSVQANQRRAVPDAFALPPAPTAEVVVHDVLADETNGYQPIEQLVAGAGQERKVWLWIEWRGDVAVVDRLPGYAVYPIRSGPSRLFTVAAGEIARYRANFRFTGGCCSPYWYYEQWTIQVANAATSIRAGADLFRHARYSCDLDERVHLYGGPQRRKAKRTPA
jgi:hypothetical protein